MTWVLVVLIALVGSVQAWRGVGSLTAVSLVPTMAADQEWWRLGTAWFAHADGIHFAGSLLVALASLDGNLGLYDEAIASAEQAANLAQAVGARVIETRAALTWAHLLYQRGAFAAALEKYQHALELARQAGEARLGGDALWGIGWMYLQMEEYASSQAPLEQALAHHRAIQDAYGEMLGMTSLGVLARRRNRLDESEGWYEQALTLCQTLGDRHFGGKFLSNPGAVPRMRYDYGAAEEAPTASLDLPKRRALRSNVQPPMDESGSLALPHARPPRAPAATARNPTALGRRPPSATHAAA